MDLADLQNRFEYHPPKDDAARYAHEFVRYECLRLAQQLDAALVDGREKSLAVTNLEQVMFWANAAIARSGVRPLTYGEQLNG